MLVAKAAVLFLYSRRVQIVAVPAFALLLLGSNPGAAWLELILVLVLADWAWQ